MGFGAAVNHVSWPLVPLRSPPSDQLTGRSATSSRAGRRAASEQDSVMEYGMKRSATRFELSRHDEIARTCLRQVGSQVCNQVCDLDSVMDFSLKQVASQLANQLATCELDNGICQICQ